MPDTSAPPTGPQDPRPAAAQEIAALRAEIDTLDDAIHDLLMRRLEVVARLAASRAKGNGPAIRPGREAMILRRLLGRHAGPLPRAALVRLWRELLSATTTLQAPLTVAAALPEGGMEVLRAHLGFAAELTRCADEAAALAAFAAGRTGLVALPLAGRWWCELDPKRLSVTARLPFFGPSAAPVFLLSPTPPDPSGEDVSLLRVPAPAAQRLGGRVLAERDGLALVEVPGMWTSQDPRLAGLGATLLGAYAVPVPA